ncbi:MAG: sugar phosphate isomerase/epimerase family protein [Planctomycetota bacterium]
MDISQIALTLFTIRDHCRTEDDFKRSLARLREIGYQTVQISAVPLEPDLIRRCCDEAGLRICATHEPSKVIVEEPQTVVEKLQILGCDATAYPHPHVGLADQTAVDGLARQLDESGAVLREAGQVLTYHNHAHELIKIGGTTILQQFYDKTDPRNLQGEIDTYWIQRGGENPVAWCERLQDRLPLLHLKDYQMVPGEREQYFGAIGDGNLDWPAILRAAEASGCRWYIVEQDKFWINDDPFEAAKRSFDYLTQLVPTL